jgi:hypothetical protein
MLKKYFWFVAIITGLLCQGVNAASSPMVEKHVFTPGQESEKEVQPEPAKIINPKELQKQFIFSGVIIGPKGKQALIRETGGKPADGPKNKPYSIGDQIKGMTIKDIGSNHIILAGQEGETKLNLYNGGKARPSPSVIAQEPQSRPPQPNQPQPDLPKMPPAQPEPGGHPGGYGVSKTLPAPVPPEVGGSSVVPGGESPAPNPFADAMKKAAERRVDGANQPPGNVVNPFMNLAQ